MAYSLFGANENRRSCAPLGTTSTTQRDLMLTHLFLFLSVEAAYTGTNDVATRMDGYRGLIDELIAKGPPAPRDLMP